jgi:putative ATP-binding cassette transporter
MHGTLGSSNGTFARRAFALVHPYWSRSGERGIAWALLLAILSITLGLVYLNVEYNYWNRNFFNALESKDHRAFWTLIPYFFALSVLTVAGGALQTYLTQMLQIRWRIWMTGEYLDDWLAKQRYYQLEQDPKGTDNPDQRIAEDLKLLATSTVDLLLGLLHNVVTLITFIAILWSVSGPIALTLAGQSLAVPGDMVWAALAYAAIGTAATYFVGRPLIGLRFQQERLEADLRYGLVRTREHAEGIALYRGEAAERQQIDSRIGGLRTNWWQIMAATFKLNTLSSVYTQIGILFPYFVASPRYFSGAITLGGLTQIAGAFDTVRVALSWFVFNYQALASWKASVDRLLTFEVALLEAERSRGQSQIARSGHEAHTLDVNSLRLSLPNGRAIVEATELSIGRGERWMLSGPPGSGKSTLFRSLSGIWPHGSGHISMPAGARMLFLPQKPYLPIGRLADAIAYPSLPQSFSTDRLREALASVGLGALDDRLGEPANWGQMLSGGEQQQLAIARALLNQPDWLFLDEATAALDEDSEARAYAALLAALPRTAIVSISHRRQLARYHNRFLTIDGGRLVAA